MLQYEKIPAQSGKQNSWCPHQKTRFLDGSRCAVLDLFLKLSGGQIAAMGIFNIVNLTIVIAILFVVIISFIIIVMISPTTTIILYDLKCHFDPQKSGTYLSGAPLCVIQPVHCVI